MIRFLTIYSVLHKLSLKTSRGFILIAFIAAVSPLSAQDIGDGDEGKFEEIEEFTDPYKLTLRARPLSFLLYPAANRRLGSFNGRIDCAIDRRVTIGLEANYFFQRPFFGANTSADMFSVRLDGNVFLFKKSNMDRFAEGFHFGPYYKFKHSDSFNPSFSSLYGVNRLISNNHILGVIIGYQYVKDRFIIDQSMGFGAGLGSSNIGLVAAADFRLGLSIGTVLF